MEEQTSGRGWKTVDYYSSKHREIKLVDWPESDKQVGVLELNCDELQKARLAAIEHFRKQNIELTIFTSAALDAEEMVQQCCIFLIDPEAKNPSYKIFRGADEARKRLTNTERFYFCSKYSELFEAE